MWLEYLTKGSNDSWLMTHRGDIGFILYIVWPQNNIFIYLWSKQTTMLGYLMG